MICSHSKSNFHFDRGSWKLWSAWRYSCVQNLWLICGKFGSKLKLIDFYSKHLNGKWRTRFFFCELIQSQNSSSTTMVTWMWNERVVVQRVWNLPVSIASWVVVEATEIVIVSPWPRVTWTLCFSSFTRPELFIRHVFSATILLLRLISHRFNIN